MRKVSKNMAYFWNKIIEHKLVLFSLLLISSYIYIMRDDYIAADAYIKPTDEYVAVTRDNPVEMTVCPAEEKIHSVLFSIQNPEIMSEASTSVSLWDGEELIAEELLSHNEYYEITDSLGNAIELLKIKGGG